MNLQILSAAVAGILWGTSGFFIRYLGNLNSIEIAWFRDISGLVFFLIVIFILRQRIKTKNRKYAILAGLTMAVWSPIYIMAINLGAKLGNAAFLLTSAYMFSVLFSWILLKDSIDKKTFAVLLVALLGVGLILKPFSLFGNFAEILALVSGIIYGLNLTFARKSQQVNDSTSTVFYLLLFSAILLFPGTLLNFQVPTSSNMFYLILFALLTTTLPIFLFTRSLKYLKTYEAGIPALLEAVTAAIIGWMAFSEILDVYSIIGGALVIGCSFYLSVKKR